MNPEVNIVAGVGVVLISLHNYIITRAFSLTELCSNSVSEYNAILIGCNLLKRLESKILKHSVIQSSSSTRFAGSTKSDIKTWCPMTTRPLLWRRSLETSTFTMYRITKMHMQRHWRPSLLHWLFQLEPQKDYLSTIMTCTVANSSLKTVEF